MIANSPHTAAVETAEPPASSFTRPRAVRIASLEPALDLAWIVIGGALSVYAWKLGAWGASGPDSGFVPLVAGVLIALCGGLLLLERARHPPAPRGPAASEPFWSEDGAWTRVCALVAGLVVLVLLVRYAGFITASALMMPVLMRLIEKRSWWFAIGVGLAATAGVHVVFAKLLGMSMPRGPWGF
jgi:putative tricarboxylic transport membrane protein